MKNIAELLRGLPWPTAYRRSYLNLLTSIGLIFTGLNGARGWVIVKNELTDNPSGFTWILVLDGGPVPPPGIQDINANYVDGVQEWASSSAAGGKQPMRVNVDENSALFFAQHWIGPHQTAPNDLDINPGKQVQLIANRFDLLPGPATKLAYKEAEHEHHKGAHSDSFTLFGSKAVSQFTFTVVGTHNAFTVPDSAWSMALLISSFTALVLVRRSIRSEGASN